MDTLGLSETLWDSAGFSWIVDHVDHAVSADHTGQVDPADCGGLADHANIY